jgi:DNA-binding protein HU-beta
MTKSEFVDQVAQRTGLSKKDAGAAVEAFLQTVEETLKSGDEVQFTGFGKFSVSSRAAREGVNPRDPGGAKIKIAARKVPRFSPGAGLKNSVA